MSKFMLILRGGDGRMAELSPEQVQAHMGRWGAYMGGLAQKGKLASGEPLNTPGKVVGKSGTVVTDGPFAEGKEIVGGYLIVEADDFDEAVEISKTCPIFEFDDSTIEVREIQVLDM